jgi:hypothetical protein
MKTTRITSACGAILFAAAAFCLLTSTARAISPLPNLTYSVTLNLSSLQLDPNGPFSLDFQLNTGSGNVTNTVTLSNFVFTGGTASGTPDFTFGTESGSLASNLILSNAGSGSEFTEAFSSGVTQISFNVSQTPNSEVVTSGTPVNDEFVADIQDSSFNSVPTTDPSGANTLVESALNETATGTSITGHVNEYSLEVVAAPEPSSYAMLVGGLVTLGVMLRRRAHKA